MLMQPFLKIATTEDERKVYLFMNDDNAEKYETLLDDIEAYVK